MEGFWDLAIWHKLAGARPGRPQLYYSQNLQPLVGV